MDEQLYWSLFLETGAPEAYLMYRSAKRNMSDGAATHLPV